MLYDLLELLLGPLLTKQEQKMPKCRTCKKRMEQMGPPRLFLLPVYSDERYSASADYLWKKLRPYPAGGGDAPTAREACRVWRLRCPVCGTQRLFVQDFLRVRQDETLEGTYLYEYQELAGLLFQQPGDRTAQTPRRMENTTCDTERLFRRCDGPGEMPGGKYRKRGINMTGSTLSSLAEQGQGMDRRLLQPHPQKQPHKSRAPDPAAHRPCARRHGASEWRRRAGAGGRSHSGTGVRSGRLRHLPGHSDGQPHPCPVHPETGTERPGAFHGRDGTGAVGKRDAGGPGGRRGSALLPDGWPQFQGDPGPGDPRRPTISCRRAARPMPCWSGCATSRRSGRAPSGRSQPHMEAAARPTTILPSIPSAFTGRTALSGDWMGTTSRTAPWASSRRNCGMTW